MTYMTSKRFNYLISGFDIKTQNWVANKIRGMRIHDPKLAYIDWQDQFNRVVNYVLRREGLTRFGK